MTFTPATLLFWVSVGACAAGEAAILFAAVRRYDDAIRPEGERRRSARRGRERWSADRREETAQQERTVSAVRALHDLGWTVLPAIGLALLLAATWARLS